MALSEGARNGGEVTEEREAAEKREMAEKKAQNQAKPSAEGTVTISGNGAISKEEEANQKQRAQPKAGDEEGGKALSNAELKRRAKLEKQARRAREKENKGQAVGQETRDEKQTSKPKGPSSDSNPPFNQPPSHLQQRRQSSTQNQAPKQAHHQALTTPNTERNQHKRTESTAKLPIRLQQQPLRSPLLPTKESKDVALFDHLYGQARRTTIAAAGKDVHPAILALGLQMSSYVICGSNARCVATLLAFKRVIESYSTPVHNSLPRHLTAHLSPQIDYLVSCRPLSTSMGNAIRWLKLAISDVDVGMPESAAKAALCHAIDHFIQERITVADDAIAASAAAKIQPGDVILTFAKSSIVQQTLLAAHRRGIDFRVIVVDSRPLFEGRRLARALAAAGLGVEYALVHALSHAVSAASKVLLGAHSMLGNGRLYARVGTALVAMMAREADVPVIVCCESIKFTDRVALDSIVTNEVAPPDELVIQSGDEAPATALEGWRDRTGLQLLNLMYDVTPAEYITMVITEYGSLPPSSVPVVFRLSTDT